MYFDGMNNQILSSKNLIYVLHHPASSSVYVGQTSKGMTRPRSHFLESNLERTKNHARSKWIRSMRARGHEPLISILEECASPDDLDEAEQFHIANMRALGFKLLNHTDGGGGLRGFRFTEEQKQACTERMKKRAEDPRYIAQRSEDMKRRNADPEFRALLEKVMERRKKDPDYSTKMSAVSKSQWNEETRKKKSIEMLGNKRTSTPHARAAASAANKGKPKSPEARAKMSEAKRRLWQDPVYRARQVAAQKKAHGTPEAKAKAAEWAKLASHDTHRSPEYREKMSEIATKAATPELRAKRSENARRTWEHGRKEAALKEFDRHLEAWNTVIQQYVVHKEEHKTC